MKTYLVPVSDELIKAMEKGEAPSFLHCATCLDGLTNGEVLMKIYGLSEEDIDVGTFSVYVYMKDKQTIIVSVDWWNSKWGE